MASPLLLALCLWIQDAPPRIDPVARIGDLSVGRAEYGEWLVSRLGVSALYDYVCDRIILLEAGKRGLMPGEAEIEAAYEAEYQQILKGAYDGDVERWKSDQIQRGYTPESARQRRLDQLRPELALAALIRADRELSDEAVLERFRSFYGDPGERVSVEVLHFNAYRDVAPGSRPDLPALKQAARERAVKVRDKWSAGAPLADLLPESDDPGRDFIVQGVIAEYRPRQMDREFDAAVAALDEPGEVSLPIDAYNGVWLVRLVSREPVTPEEVHDELVAGLRDAPVESGEINAMRNGLMERYQPELLLR